VTALPRPDVDAGPTTWMMENEAYLQLKLERLRLVIERRVAWLRTHGWSDDAMRDYQHLVVSDAQVDRMLLPAHRGAQDHHDSAAIDAAIAELNVRMQTKERELRDHGGGSGLEVLGNMAGLTAFESDVLFLSLAPELEAGFGRLYAYLHDNAALTYATPGLAADLSDAWSPIAWESFLPDTPLSHLRILDPASSDGLVPMAAQRLRPDARLTAFVRGVNQPDARLRSIVEPLQALPLGSEQHAIVQKYVTWLTAAGNSEISEGINLVGRPGAGRRSIAANLCGELGMALLEVDVPMLIASPRRDELIGLLGREALLLPAALYLDAEDGTRGESTSSDDWRRVADDLNGFVVVGSRDRRRLRRQLVTVDLPDPDPVMGSELWKAALGGDVDQNLGSLLEQFRFGPHGVQEGAAQARALAELRGGAGTAPAADELWNACRVHAGHELGELAQRLEVSADWDQLVLPDESVAQLREIADQVSNRDTVYGEWGWGARLGRGGGISALFAGPSGTGKTMAAEILAASLNLDLYRIDLSQVVSKYIGETEKNLARLFDAAERGGAILFFDEADALFGKRTEVKDSHDRYANIEINYLLQRMEDYRGLAILASNRKADLDDAFMRRIRFLVTFPFPDPASRMKIWQVIFPPGVPTSDLDSGFLARLEIAGGNIKNVAINASFLAANEDVPVGMDQVMRSARQEYQKIEKLVSRSEFGEYSRNGI
jgi:hypothetical protein